MVGGGRPNLMLAQVQVFCPGPGPGQDLTGTGPGMGPGMGPGPELDNFTFLIFYLCSSIPRFHRVVWPPVSQPPEKGCDTYFYSHSLI